MCLLFIRRASPQAREAGKRPLSSQPVSIHPLQPRVPLRVTDIHLGPVENGLNRKDKDTHVAVFLVLQACSHPSPPHQHLPDNRRGWGLPANPLLASLRPGCSSPTSAEAHLWRVPNGAFLPDWVTWAGRGALGWGGGMQTSYSWILEAAMMLPLSPVLEIKNFGRGGVWNSRSWGWGWQEKLPVPQNCQQDMNQQGPSPPFQSLLSTHREEPPLRAGCHTASASPLGLKGFFSWSLKCK